MIVRQFLQWIRHAPAGDRAEATSALARAYLHSDLSTDDLAAAEGAMIMLLDDPSPLVRGALSQVFASSQKAPPVVVHALAADQPDVALPILSRSPLLADEDLVDLFATGHPDAQVAIAGRALLSRPLAAAIAEVGPAESCLALIENPDADIATFSIDRIVERHGHLSAIRETLIGRPDLPMATRQALLAKLSQTLAGFVSARHWLGSEHAEYAAREACEKATVALAAETPYEEIGELMHHLRQSGQLTAGMILRALLSGNVVLFEEALAELSGMPIDRVTGYIHDKHISGFRALYSQSRVARRCLSRLPRSDRGDARRRSHRRCRRRVASQAPHGRARARRHARPNAAMTMASLLALLRRFSVEAAREEARMFCDDLVANDFIAPPFAPRLEDARMVA